jgi:hypothetical protein
VRREAGSRLPPALRAPLAVALLWLVLGIGVVALRAAAGLEGSVCWLKRLTGVPCPTCGSTRAMLALAHADPWLALRQSPFVVAALGAALVWAVVLRRRPTARELRLGWPIALGLLLVGWIWVIVDGR